MAVPFAASRHRRLRAYYNLHAGATAFLIGNGPSVRMGDLERLTGDVTFCANRFHLAYPRTSFRPRYTVVSDRQMIEDFGREIAAAADSPVFVCSEWPVRLNRDCVWLRLRNTRPWNSPARLHWYIYQTGATLLAALQIGLYMGIRRFVLYGVDFEFKYRPVDNPVDPARSVVGEGNHFIENYRGGRPWAPPAFDLIEHSLGFYADWLRERGGWIANATRGGRLEIVPRVDFDDVLRQYHEAPDADMADSFPEIHLAAPRVPVKTG